MAPWSYTESRLGRILSIVDLRDLAFGALSCD